MGEFSLHENVKLQLKSKIWIAKFYTLGETLTFNHII